MSQSFASSCVHLIQEYPSPRPLDSSRNFQKNKKSISNQRKNYSHSVLKKTSIQPSSFIAPFHQSIAGIFNEPNQIFSSSGNNSDMLLRERIHIIPQSPEFWITNKLYERALSKNDINTFQIKQDRFYSHETNNKKFWRKICCLKSKKKSYCVETKKVPLEKQETRDISNFEVTRNDIDTRKSIVRKTSLNSVNQASLGLTFDAFEDFSKGREFTSMLSEYPSYKTDKRILFLGEEFKYPKFVISNQSSTRKYWNLIILTLIFYEIFYYSLGITFLFNTEASLGNIIFEVISAIIFLLDILINFHTTYSNEANEEIIDRKMIAKTYKASKMFVIDVITIIPLSEMLLLIFSEHEQKHLLYSVFKLIKLLRILKIKSYSKSWPVIFSNKTIKALIIFSISVHLMSCGWMLLLKVEFFNTNKPSDLWFPPTLRTITEESNDLFKFYEDMSLSQIYGLITLSVFLLMNGAEMALATTFESYFYIIIELCGAFLVGYVISLMISEVHGINNKNLNYEEQLESLTQKMEKDKIPANFRAKIIEYFNYTWKKQQSLQAMNDFSELSLPLQRDLLLYLKQDLALKVPLFKELEPIEVLSIVQKLKTSVYLPGDKIFREGDPGSEMFFIKEGVVELVSKHIIYHQTRNNPESFQKKVYLDKGCYFGEISLISNSKRVNDANAFEFCILESFSRIDYENLRNEFKDIGPRLRAGLKHYKNEYKELLLLLLKNSNLFRNFEDEELQIICDKYLEEIFVDPGRIILKPKNMTNGIYVVLNGEVKCYENTEQTKAYLSQLKKSQYGNAQTINLAPLNLTKPIRSLDDEILSWQKDKESIEHQKKRLNVINIYHSGEYFGGIEIAKENNNCEGFYVSELGCQVGVITKTLVSKMSRENNRLYQKFKANLIKFSFSAQKKFLPINEEDEIHTSIISNNQTTLNLPKPYELSHNLTSIEWLIEYEDNLGSNLLHGDSKLMTSKISKEDYLKSKIQIHHYKEKIHALKAIFTKINMKFSYMLNEQSDFIEDSVKLPPSFCESFLECLSS